MEKEEVEAPECPVCLNPYDAVTIIPRVLPCGHSTCQSCLSRLPNPFPYTIRCPSCTLLLNYPTRNPSSFPKNFDLLRLSSLLQYHHPSSIPNNVISPLTHTSSSFIPSSYSHEFYANWIKWVLPSYVVLADEEPIPGNEERTGNFVKTVFNNHDKSLFGYILEDGDILGLVKVGSFLEDVNDVFKYSYEAKIMKTLHDLGDTWRDDTGLLLSASLIRLSGVGKVFGFWYDEDNSSVYMVCESFIGGLAKKMDGWDYGFIGNTQEDMGLSRITTFGMMAMEICEALSSLHSKGLVIGCLNASCFGFNEYGRVYIDFSEVVKMGRRVCRSILDEDLRLRLNSSSHVLENHVFLSPEVVFTLFRKEGVELKYSWTSDVWALGCLLVWLLIGKPFVDVMCNYYSDFLFNELTDDENKYTLWMEKLLTLLETKLNSEFVQLKAILLKCFEFDPRDRPALTELWKSIRELIIKPEFDVIASGIKPKVPQKKKPQCVILGELCQVHKPLSQEGESRDVGEAVSGNHVRTIDLRAHLNCITALTVGGGFLFSASYDKIVHVWSLEDFSHVHSLEGHEHRVMGVGFVEYEGESLCISGDSGGVICVWEAKIPFSMEPKRCMYEEKDWRYTGIHALAVSETGFVYTGGGDRTVKAWSLQDYTLQDIMSGHKSTVSSLAVSNGVLYSGSWDGTVRLWSLGDHSPLAVLGEERVDIMSSILSLSADSDVLVVAHEDGSVKMWHNATLLKCDREVHKGAVFSVIVKGKWLFASAWDKTISVQELSGDGANMEARPVGRINSGSAVTILAYWQGKLFSGQADGLIKVYYSSS